MLAGSIRPLRSVIVPVVFALLLAAACGRPATEPLPRNEWRAFAGNWSATGTRRTLHLGPDQRSSIVHLTGSVLLVGERRMGVGFHGEVIGFTDSRTGFTGRCVWTDEQGDEVHSELQGELIGSGNRITARIVGGTGRFADITGDYAFEWQYVVATDDGAISGRTVNLAGRACIGTPPGESPAVPPADPPAAEDGR